MAKGIDTAKVQQYMKAFNLTEEDAIKMIEDDALIDAGGKCDWEQEMTPEQKKAVIRSTLERAVRKNLERNAFRYAKISEEDDDAWYHCIKSSAADPHMASARGSDDNPHTDAGPRTDDDPRADAGTQTEPSPAQ